MEAALVSAITNPQAIMTLGLGGVSFLVLMWLVIKTIPVINELKISNEVSKESMMAAIELQKEVADNNMQQITRIADNFTIVVDKIEDSNNNIAQSLEILRESQANISKMIDRQDSVLLDMQTKIAVIHHDITNDKQK